VRDALGTALWLLLSGCLVVGVAVATNATLGLMEGWGEKAAGRSGIAFAVFMVVQMLTLLAALALALLGIALLGIETFDFVEDIA
jgi:hypothetical protein